MTKHCQNCVYHMSGNPPVCNALHTPIAGEIDCVDWKANEASAGGLTPDGLYLRERLDQGQVPIAEIIQRGRSEQVEQWRNYLSIECLGAIEEAIRSQIELLPDHLQHLVLHNRNLLPSFFRLASQYVTIPHPEYWENDRLVELAEREAMMQSQANQTFGYEIQESIEARRAAIARDTQRRADEAIAPIAFTFRVDRDRDSYAFVNCVFENGREVARDLQRQEDEAIALSELQTMCARHLNPFRDGQELHVRSQSTGRLIEFIAIATPNGLKWQYQGAVIID